MIGTILEASIVALMVLLVAYPLALTIMEMAHERLSRFNRVHRGVVRCSQEGKLA